MRTRAEIKYELGLIEEKIRSAKMHRRLVEETTPKSEREPQSVYVARLRALDDKKLELIRELTAL